MIVVFCFVGFITFDTFYPLNPIYKSHVALHLAILILEYARIHVHSIYCSDVASYIERPVNESFSREAAL